MLTIDADMAVQGQLVVLGTVRLEGRFDGAIICSRLEIGPDGYLFGSVVTEDLRVEGQVVGTVRAIRVHLTGSALLEGELFHETLRMDEAATLVGESRRQRSLQMPAEFLAMQARALQNDEEMRNLEVDSRVRRADAAALEDERFQTLRTRFPSGAPAKSFAY